jgi:hypothetical protein
MNAEKIKELRGLIAQWRATNCRTEAQDRVYRVCADQLEPLLAALLDEVEALTADAERYRHLRSLEFAPKKGPFIAYQTPWGCSMRNGSHADTATDAARHEPKDAE